MVILAVALLAEEGASAALWGIIITSIATIIATGITVLGNRSRKSATATATEAADYIAALEAKTALVHALEDRVKYLEDELVRKEGRLDQIQDELREVSEECRKEIKKLQTDLLSRQKRKG